MENLLKMSNISKRFAGVQALKEVELEVRRGEVMGIMGENGAGKSTLMKILLGLYHADAGTVEFKGREVHYRAPIDALKDGISMIHQEISLVPSLSVAENIWLGREFLFQKYGLISEQMRTSKTQELLEEIGIKLNPNELVRNLSIANCQMVEIVRAISYRADLIIMDEPTSALTDEEVNILFRVIRQLKADGKGVIFITHKMDEVGEICDRLTVFRDGQFISVVNASDITQKELISLIAGRELSEMFPKEYAPIGDVIMEVRGLTGKGFHNIHFELHKGEILGFCGLVGAGRTETMKAIFGLEKYSDGEILLNGQPVRLRGPGDAIRHGMAMVTEDRLREGAIHKLGVRVNMSLSYFDKICRLGFYDGAREKRDCGAQVEALSIAASSMDALISSLSGGNQQKVILGRWLLTEPKVLILDEPTRGIDVGSKAEIHHLICKLAQRGVAIILISSEMPEILGMSDRIIVLHEGTQTYECSREEAEQETIMQHAFGL